MEEEILKNEIFTIFSNDEFKGLFSPKEDINDECPFGQAPDVHEIDYCFG